MIHFLFALSRQVSERKVVDQSLSGSHRSISMSSSPTRRKNRFGCGVNGAVGANKCCPETQFTDWYARTLGMECQSPYCVRERFWSDAAAVGSRRRVEAIAGALPRSWYEREAGPPSPGRTGGDSGTCVLRVSDRIREGLLGILGR